MHTTSEIAIEERAVPTASNWPVAVLGLMMFLVPAVGATTELLLQDTLKSAMVAFGVLGAALLFFWQQRQRTEPLLWHGLVALPLTLMLYALASMAWSHTYLAAVEAIRWFVLTLLLWLGLNTLNRNNLPTLVWGIHVGAVIASIWAALQFWLDFRLFPQGPQPASTFYNRNFFAEYAVFALPFSVGLLANLRPTRWLGWMALSVAVNVVVIMMTGTRSALAALMMLSAVFPIILVRYRQQLSFIQWSRFNKGVVAFTLIAGIGIMGSVPSENPQVIKEKTGITALERSFLRTASMVVSKEYTEGSFSIRSVMWKATARMMMANPLTGVGAGAWEVNIPLYQRTDTMLETDYYAHNEFLQLLSEYGVLVGGMVLAFLWAYLLKSAGTTWRLHGTDKKEGPVRAFTLTSLLALMIVSNAGFPWHLAGCGALLALCLAILAGSDARLGLLHRFYTVELRWRPTYSLAGLILLMSSTALAFYITYQAMKVEHKIMHALQLSAIISRPDPSKANASETAKVQILQETREAIAINPHYRKLTAMVAEPLSATGDWANAVWVLESVAASRPNVAAIWTALAVGYSQLKQHDQAYQALQQVQRLKPEALGTKSLRVSLLSNSGQYKEATDLLITYYDLGQYDYEMVQTGYAIGLKTHNWPLAIRSLTLRNVTWPEQAADGYFRLGKVYADPALHDDAKALAAFQSGLATVPPEQKENYRSQVPLHYRAKM